MSQSSIRSATSAFSLYNNSHNGDGESNDTVSPTASTRLDKQIASVTRLQLNAIQLNKAAAAIDDVLDSLDRFTWPGKSKDSANLKGLKCTLVSVSKHVEEDALILSPIPSMQYVAQRRRAVSPESNDVDVVSTNKRKLPTRSSLKQPPSKRLDVGTFELEYNAPANGTEYTTKEAYYLQKKHIKHRGKLVKHDLSNHGMST